MLLFNDISSPQKAYAFLVYPSDSPELAKCHRLDSLSQYHCSDNFHTRSGSPFDQLNLHIDLKELLKRIRLAFPYTIEDGSFSIRIYSYTKDQLRPMYDCYHVLVKDCQLIRDFRLTLSNIQNYYEAL